ncbi:sugar transferase [Sphingomonas sp. CFBP 13603]|uniref:sugar transferase n=1 Tax=Sphingomonas sp. CFBP 13603 TaxID=2774040 RepID=UPI001FD316A1|nr:sugar transferase [Sphingomonas sp. CFBP 13603]
MDFYGDVRTRFRVHSGLNGALGMASRANLRRKVDGNISRLIDIVFSSTAFLILLPVIALICIAIVVQDGGSPFFVHRRIGRGGRLFPCLKLRTMVLDSEARLRRHLEENPEAQAEWALDQKLRNDPRITPLGVFLRKSSLDELPQLLNVVWGHMSLVGPRPIVPAEVPRYGRYMEFYCNMRPGITGLWQVSGRNDISYRRRVAMDTIYSRTRWFGSDIWIMVRTVPAVFASKGSF